jgi:hypothetical protein
VPRRADGGEVRSERVILRLTPTGRDVLDELRGTQSRSAYIRSLLGREAANRPRRRDP